MGVIQVDYRDRRPIYEQLVGNIRALILRGVLLPDEKRPSVRCLAAELAINPNTIQKAYAELERIGMIYSSPGRGSFVSGESSILRRESFRLAQESLAAAMHEAKLSGFSADAARKLINEIWREES